MLHRMKVIAFADWENKTAGTIASRASKERLRALEGADTAALLARRHRVADLYNREMEQWEHEVLLRVCVQLLRFVEAREESLLVTCAA